MMKFFVKIDNAFQSFTIYTWKLCGRCLIGSCMHLCIEAIAEYALLIVYVSLMRVSSQQYTLSCRAAAYTKLNENIKAIADCQKAISIDPNYGKAYGRMG